MNPLTGGLCNTNNTFVCNGLMLMNALKDKSRKKIKALVLNVNSVIFCFLPQINLYEKKYCKI